MTPQTDILLDVSGQSGAVDGDWYTTKPEKDDKLPIVVTIGAGTATWIVQGRNKAGDAPVQLATASASGGANVDRYAQVRVILSAATGATVTATAPYPMRAVA